jgi:hypothetical protein
VVARRGVSTLGCLVPLLLAAVVAYFGFPAGEAYFKFYQYKDAMGQEARFASTQSDEHIRRRLVSLADSLHMPTGAELVSIERTPGTVTISAEYDEIIRLPFNKSKVITFRPWVRSRL